MASKSASKRISDLRQQIEHHNHLYFVAGAPVISDAEYDALFRELLDLERSHPELVTPESPTQRVGAALPEGQGFARVRHAVPMLSIESLFDEAGVRDFEERIVRFLRLGSGEGLVWIVEPKFDGVSASLVYERGLFARGVTRGDGVVGEDVTANLRTVRNIPLRLQGRERPFPESLEVRGEVFMERAEFQRFNAERVAQGLPPFANARNATAGAVRRNDPAEVARYPLKFHAWSVPRAASLGLEKHWNLLEALRDWGFARSSFTRRAQGLSECLEVHAELLRRRAELPYEIDGIVAKLDDLALRERLGSTSRSPRWQFAYKFPASEATSRLLAIEVMTGALGRLTPRAHLEQVEMGGVTVRHATLHNAEYVQAMRLRVGDRVFLHRAGDVIPQVSGVAEAADGEEPAGWKEGLPGELRKNGDVREGVLWEWKQPFAMPSSCPSCGSPLLAEGKYWRCPNESGCRPQVIGRTRIFCGRNGFEIEGLGERMIDQLLDAGLIQGPADLFHLSSRRAELVELERWGEKTVDNLFAQLEQRAEPSFERFLCALAIPEVGPATARLLAAHYGSIDELRAAESSELEAIEGIGPEMAAAICGWFARPESERFLARLAEGGVRIRYSKEEGGQDGVLRGKTVVFTGTLTRMTRAEAKRLAEREGARVATSLSARTDMLVVGEKPGSKVAQARQLGVAILDEQEFCERVGTGAGDSP
jgi:DNA ligase (NAD+)